MCEKKCCSPDRPGRPRLIGRTGQAAERGGQDKARQAMSGQGESQQASQQGSFPDLAVEPGQLA